MCTLTLLPLKTPAGPMLRLAFNRDELRRRMQALPPRRFACGTRQIVMPIDPESTGTWIALSDAGVTLALMNLNPPHPSPKAPRRSRGAVIPALLSADVLESMCRAAMALPLPDFARFRLVLATLEEVAVLEHTGGPALRITTRTLETPLLFTSSGLGDHLVEGPRRALFDAMLAAPEPGRQDAFHRHHWPDRPHLSVCMARSDARTVSHTLVHLTPEYALMTYLADAPDQPINPEIHSLELRQPEAACTP
jgi:hypothetical protein